MVKLTEPQRKILLHGGGNISFVPSSGNAWTSNKDGFCIRVRSQIFNSLTLNGVIAKTSERHMAGITTHFYELTDAGRSALNEEVRK